MISQYSFLYLQYPYHAWFSNGLLFRVESLFLLGRRVGGAGLRLLLLGKEGVGYERCDRNRPYGLMLFQDARYG